MYANGLLHSGSENCLGCFCFLKKCILMVNCPYHLFQNSFNKISPNSSRFSSWITSTYQPKLKLSLPWRHFKSCILFAWIKLHTVLNRLWQPILSSLCIQCCQHSCAWCTYAAALQFSSAGLTAGVTCQTHSTGREKIPVKNWEFVGTSSSTLNLSHTENVSIYLSRKVLVLIKSDILLSCPVWRWKRNHSGVHRKGFAHCSCA